MKGNTILFAFIFCIYTALNGQAFIVPSTNNNASAISCECYQLTPQAYYQHGAVWNQNQVNLNNPFDYKFSIFLGSNNGAGADGIVFVIQNQSQTIPPSVGGGMGYGAFTGRSFGIEYDTHDNGPSLDDIPQEHIAVDTNGVLQFALAGPIPALPGGANIDDGQWHTTEIKWNPGTNTLMVYFDANLRITTTFPGGLVNDIFNGQNIQYWGWTGATGGADNVQQMCIFFQPDFTAGINFTHCGTDTVNFQSSSTSGLNAIAGYRWDFGDGDSSNLQNPQHTFPSPGTYNVKLTIIDQSLCTKDTTYAVTIRPLPSLASGQNNVSCFNGNDGRATVTASGATAPYSYLWSPGAGTSPVITGLAAGIYAVTVKDFYGCSSTAADTLTQPTQLTSGETHVNVLCNGNATGAVRITAGGGTPGYTYAWLPNVSTVDSAINIHAANYSITITDANNCTLVQTSNVSEPPLLTATETHVGALCSGSTGSVTITPAGGTPSYTYRWNPNVSTTDSAGNLSPATYHITVTDANSCSFLISSTVSTPFPIVLSQTHVNELCFGDSTGSISVNTSGGTPAYTYQWNPNVSATSSATALSAGLYAVTVSDNNHCTDTISYAITQPPAIATRETHTNVLCHGSSTGSVTIIAGGGTPGYSYTWSPNVSSTDSATNIPAASYSVKVTDANSCTALQTSTVTEPPALSTSETHVNVLCGGQATGSIAVSVNGGTPGYTFNWFPNVSTTDSATNILAGNYSITVTDANLCNTIQTSTVTEPLVLTATEINSDELCHGASTAYIILTVSGGTASFTFNWSPNVSTTDSALNVPAGGYSATVTDANNCTFVQTATVHEPSAIVLTADSSSVRCYGQTTGTITLSATGGTPVYNFFADGAGQQLNSTNGLFNNLAAATYTVGVTDNNGCVDSTTATVSQPPVLAASIAPVNPTCYHEANGKVVVVGNGGTNHYSYSFYNGFVNTSGIITGLVAGSYSVTVTDSSLCTFIDSTLLTQPDSVLVEITPVVTQIKLGQPLQLTSSSNQTGTVDYSWSPGFGLSCDNCADPVFNGVYSQAYTVVATNQDGCKGTSQFTVTVIPDYDIFFPNAFTPNGDGVNDLWQLFGNLGAIKQFEIMVFNRIGEKVFESNDLNFKWDGTYKGTYAPAGAYLYAAKIVWLNNYSNNTVKGSITLLR